MNKTTKFFIFGLILLLLGGGWYFGKRLFNRVMEQRQVTAAQGFLRKGDLRSASLSARQALNYNSNSIEATRLMSSVAELAGSPDTLLWKQRVVELTPGQAGPLQDLALTAIKFGETFTAEQALSQISEKDRNTSAYHQAAAAMATATKRYPLAVKEFQKALDLDPQNSLVQFNLAALRLQSSNPEEINRARAELEQLRSQPATRLLALRALLSDARRRQEWARAMDLAVEIDRDPAATIVDRLLYLEELQHAKDPAFEEKVVALGDTAKKSAVGAYQYLIWMNAHGLATRSIEWYLTLPETMRAQMPLPFAAAEACVIAGEWKALTKLLDNVSWGPMDFMRMAFMARAVGETTQTPHGPLSQAKWDRAITCTAGDSNALAMLARMAEAWGWKDEATQAWWLIARHKSGQRVALRNLNRLFTDSKNTHELYHVAQRTHELEPENFAASNNTAYYGLLLRQDLPEVQKVAEANYHSAPNQPVFASTYALSLHRQKQDAAARDILQKLPEPFLRQPAVAACYGAVLTATGDLDKARVFLGIAADNRQQLLPEEAALADEVSVPSR